MSRDPGSDARRCATLGGVLIALGVLGILWGVLYVLDRVDAFEQRDFAHRLTYDATKAKLHECFLGGLARSLGGLGVALLGGRLRSRALAARDDAGAS